MVIQIVTIKFALGNMLKSLKKINQVLLRVESGNLLINAVTIPDD